MVHSVKSLSFLQKNPTGRNKKITMHLSLHSFVNISGDKIPLHILQNCMIVEKYVSKVKEIDEVQKSIKLLRSLFLWLILT